MNVSGKVKLAVVPRGGVESSADPRIPMCRPFMLGMVCLAQTKQVVDPTIVEMRFERTDLVKRVIAQGQAEQSLLRLGRTLDQTRIYNANAPAVQRKHKNHLQLYPSWRPSLRNWVLVQQVTQENPGYIRTNSAQSSGISKAGHSSRYIGWIAPLRPRLCLGPTVFMVLFTQTEEELRKVRNPTWVCACESDYRSKNKRVGLVISALSGEDDKCPRIMAQGFQKPRLGLKLLEPYLLGQHR